MLGAVACLVNILPPSSFIVNDELKKCGMEYYEAEKVLKEKKITSVRNRLKIFD